MPSIIPPPKELLWCREHASIAAWMAKNDLGLMFYGSFLNYCARSMDKLRSVNGRLLKRHLQHIRDTLTTEPLSGAAVLHEMEFYYNRFYKTGLIKSGAWPLDDLCKSHLSFTFAISKISIPLLPMLLMYSYQKAASDREGYDCPVREAVSHGLTGHTSSSRQLCALR
jgi:hypothetical protein